MNRANDVSVAAPKLALLAISLLGAILASSVLITGDSVTVSNGETLPQNLLILGAALVAALAGWQVLPYRRPLAVPAILLWVVVAWLMFSTVSATLRADGRAAWNNFWHVLALLMMALMAAQVTGRPAVARAMLQMVLLCAVFQATYAVHQYFVSMPAARAEYIADPDAALLKAQIDAPPGSELRTQYENRLLGSFEPAGTFVLANSLAVLLSGAIVALGWVVWPRLSFSSVASKSKTTHLSMWIARAVWLVLVCVWLLTKSRSGFLAVVLVAAVAFLIQRFSQRNFKQPIAVDAQSTTTPSSRNSGLRWALAAAAMVVLMGAAVGLLSSDRLVFSEAPKSVLYRLEYWQATSLMILDFPLTGVGLGNFQSYYPAYKLPAASEVIADPHNWLFDLAVNCSLPLLVVALLALAWAMRSAARHALTDSDSPIRVDAHDKTYLVAFWSGGLVSFMVVGALQLVLGELVDFDATMLGFMAAGFTWFWIRVLPDSERAVRASALLAVVTMLVSLLASGCWQASGMALPMASLFAIGCPTEQSLVAPGKQRSTGAYVSLACLAAALLAFFWQTWQPVQTSWALEQQAMSAWGQGRAESAVSLVKEAIAADRMSAAPRRMLVQFSMEQAVSAARRASATEFTSSAMQIDAAIDDLLTTDSISNLNYAYAGECNLALAAGCVSWNPQVGLDRVKSAAEHYRQALLRYPTNAGLRAQLAVVESWLDLQNGKQLSESAKEQLAEAYRLSEITPHSNRKLAAQQVFLPPQLADPFTAEAIVRANPSSPWVQAEPVCEFLRKL